MRKFLPGIIFVVILSAVGFVFFNISNSQITAPDPKAPLKKGIKLAHYHQTLTDKGKVIVGDPTSQNKTELEPQISLSKWDEVNLDISYDIGTSKPEAIDDGIVWKGDEQDLIYKEIKANQPIAQNNIPKKPIVQLAANLSDVRLLRFGTSTLSKIASSYELFEQSASPDPTITTYIPDEDGYFFFGYKEADKDLINPRDIKYPIVRLKADQENFTCPVIPFTKNGGFVVRFYKPGLSNNGNHYRDKMVEAINLALQKEGVTKKIERRIDFLYYMDGIRPVQVGRIGYDTNNLILYIYTNSPLQGGPLQDNVRVQLLLRDTLFPFSDLKSLKPDITAVFGDKIVDKFLELENLNGITDTLTPDEEALLRGLEGLQKESDWKYEAKRSDLSHRNNTDQFDKFEFDILLHQVPDSNVFTYQIETEGLDFFYQPELSEEEKNNGSYQPENVIGSYAVYKKDVNPLYDNHVDAEKYKTGKVMHIYRPKVIDDKGDWIWGELNVDAQKGILTVTVDKNWLQKAAYPVLVDPTFGYTEIGITSNSVDDTIRGSYYMMPEDGNITQISAYLTFCFTGNTPITMADGSTKKIKDVARGDKVLSYNVNNKLLEPDIVNATSSHSTTEIDDYYLLITTSDNKKTEVTPSHPVFVEGKWISAAYLEENDKLMNSTGNTVYVLSTEKIFKKVDLYSLEVEKNQNYFANFLVHNKKILSPLHNKTAIYAQSNNSLLVTSNELATMTETGSWMDFNVSSTPATALNNYWLFAWGDSGGLMRDSGGNGAHQSEVYGEWPDTMNFTGTDTNMYSIYATYSTGGPSNFRGNVNLKGNVNLR